MNHVKQLFQTKKDLREWWAKVTSDPRFDDVLLHVRSMILEYNQTTESLAGARHYENALTSIGQGEELIDDFPNPGLHHQLDIMDLKQQIPK